MLLPPYLRLMRLHQPVGIWLLLWPCWWSITLASPGAPPLMTLALFALGAVVMRSAGCVINDIADREFDARVERTQSRPLASGELSVASALALLAGLLALAAAIAWPLGSNVLLWAAASLPLVAGYPFMKRLTWWPQLFLGLTFNWGALMGWVAARGGVEAPAIFLYLGGVFWTLGYDTIYAHQDKKDDARIGVKSTALRLGNKTKPALAAFYGLALTFWALAGEAAGSGAWFYLALALTALHFSRQIYSVDLDDPAACRRVFVSNVRLGGLLWLGCLNFN